MACTTNWHTYRGSVAANSVAKKKGRASLILHWQMNASSWMLEGSQRQHSLIVSNVKNPRSSNSCSKVVRVKRHGRGNVAAYHFPDVKHRWWRRSWGRESDCLAAGCFLQFLSYSYFRISSVSHPFSSRSLTKCSFYLFFFLKTQFFRSALLIRPVLHLLLFRKISS